MSDTTAAPLWTSLNAADFDTTTELTLFGMCDADNSCRPRPADDCGTPDLFTVAETGR
jgi:hypothetical protein